MATWQEVVDKIGTISVGAGTILGNPLIAGGGGALKFIASAFGLKKENPSPEEVMTAIQTDPQAAMKLEMARMDFEKERMKLEYEEKDKARDDEIEKLKVIVGDVQNARNMVTEQTKATGKRDINLYVISYMVIGGFFGILLTLIFCTLPTGSVGPINQLFGSLTIGFGMVLGYHFGTTAGSKSKNDMIFNSTPIEKK